jgi:hypothetical protein
MREEDATTAMDAPSPTEAGPDGSSSGSDGGSGDAQTDGGTVVDSGPPIDAAWTGRPPAAPLFVRNPYLNVWAGADSTSGAWPTLWNGAVKGMVGIARVDGTPHLLIGNLSPSGLTQLSTATPLVSSSMTPTNTEYVFSAGGASITLDFLSPVEISDLQHQSAPIGYLTATAASTDGASHAISLYFDISGEWANGDDAQEVNWTRESVAHDGGTLTVQSITSQFPTPVSEENDAGTITDYADWGTAYVAADAPGLTVAMGSDVNLRTMAVTSGTLDNSTNNSPPDAGMPRAIEDDWPVLGFAFDLGTVSAAAATAPLKLEVGFARTPAVSYQASQLQPLWATYWSKWESMAADIYDDYPNALSRAQALDQRIVKDALAANGEHYAALCTLALRQAFAGTELVASPSGDPWLYLKEISSDGNVSTVDVVYPASPVFLYTNPIFLKYLLDPLLTYAESGLWPEQFSMHDLGSNYPVGNGHNNGGGENMPVEESANMLLMMAAYAQRANPTDGAAFATAHYTIAKQWTGFLTALDSNNLATGLDPQGANVYTTDDFCESQPDIANLSLKAVLGVGAMGVLAQIAGNTADATSYTSQAKALMAQWVTLATDPNAPHTMFAYNQSGTWGLKYNAFYDKELGMNLIPASVVSDDATFYATQALAFGIPLDSRFTTSGSSCAPNGSKTDWQLWMASAIDDPGVVTTLIDGVYGFATTSSARVPFSDYYDTKAGQQLAFQARPVQGGMFSFLALSGTSIVAQ